MLKDKIEKKIKKMIKKNKTNNNQMNDDQIIYKNIYEIKYRGIKLRKKTFKNIESKTNNNKKNKN
jgi:hypothetical protein